MTKETNQVSGKIANSFLDRGDGIVEFPNGLVITDDSVMWSGTKYDIESLNIDEYPGQLTLDHFDSIGGDYLIGKAEGVKKQGNKVTIERIRYAINASENAKRAYELLIGGFSNAFSIETIGPWANEDDNTMYNHKLVGLSQVVMGNNKHAVANSINPVTRPQGEFVIEDKENCSAIHEIHVECEVEPQSAEGEEVTEEVIEAQEAEKAVEETEVVAEETKAEEVVENEIAEDKVEEAVDDKEVVEESEEKVEEEAEEAEAEAEAEEAAPEAEEVAPVIEEAAPAEEEAEKVDNEAEPEVPAEDKKEEPEVTETVADDTAEEEVAEPAEEEAEEIQTNNVEENVMTKEEITKMINEAVKEIVDAQAAPAVEEPAVEEVEVKEDNSYSLEKHANAALKAIRTRSASDYEVLNKINAKNLESLKAAGKVANSVTIADFGNFVLPAEQWKEIMGKRTDYTPLIEATDWRETDRLEFAWLTRSGDIDMKNVAACEARPAVDPDTSNLKPISVYGAQVHTEHMEHLGAVTPVCSAATKYLVVDLVADAIKGYRNDYDRKRAELVIAKLQEAVNISGNKVEFDTTASDENKLKSFIAAMRELGDATANGVFLFNFKTLLKIMEYITPRESALGDRAFDAGKDGIKRIFGVPYIVVPNGLMPTLDDDAANNPVISFLPTGASSETPQNITITSPVFYGDLSYFTGYTSGGLQLDLDEAAAYETAAGTVRSAYQRDEIVLRGYFWRGAAYKLPSEMAAITNEALSA